MKKFILVLLMVTMGFGSSHAYAARYTLVENKSDVVFFASSTLHDFQGHAGLMRGQAVLEPSAGKNTGPFEVILTTRGLHTGSQRRDEAMFKMFAAGLFPEISFTGGSLECAEKMEDGLQACQAGGQLRIRAMERPVVFPVTIKPVSKGIWAAGDLSVSLNDFQLKPPSVLGLVRVSDRVNIHFESWWQEEKQ